MINTNQLKAYEWFCRWIFPASYSLKFLAVAFLGIHVPLIVFAIYLANKHGFKDSLVDLLVVLTATLAGTVMTLWLQYRLLAPIRLTAAALRAYRTTRSVWKLPENSPDEAGELMRSTRDCLQNLDQLMRLKDNLAAGIAHDFRSPLMAICLGTELALADEQMSPETRKVVARMRATAEAQQRQLTGLLNAVLDDTRNARFDLAPVEVAKIWEDVRSTLETVAQHRGISLEFAHTNAVVAADAARITQVLNNLTSNAIQATPTGGSVRLSVEANGEAWRLHVRDTGPGLEAEVLSRQLREEQSTPIKLGLGLRLAHSLVRLHSSRLQIESSAGGTDFSFDLQRAK